MKVRDLPLRHYGKLLTGGIVLRVGPAGSVNDVQVVDSMDRLCNANVLDCEDVTPQVHALLSDLSRTWPDDDGTVSEIVFDIATTTAATLECAQNIPEFNLIITEINDDLGGRLGVYQLCGQVARCLDKYRREFETEDYPGTFDYEVPARFWHAWCEETNQVFRTEWLETGAHRVSQGWPAGAVKDRTSDSVLDRIARTVVKQWFHPPCEWRVVLRKTDIRYILAASFKEAYSMAAQRWDIDSVTSIEKKS